ncbi:MAG TPA: HAD-IIIA family hydrolase [Flavipsychrobacter sp.]|nr:HAD-IIIA family hydrolase [Flavipsychrobacter sp.]
MTINTQAQIDKSWTLFLDRDGVINVENVGSYITDWTEFKFCEGATEAIKYLSEMFGAVIVVSNQRGVGKGIMTLNDLKEINSNMVNAIAHAGGKVDKVYAATSIHDSDHNRKPNTGMAMQAKEDFPMVDFKRSVMVGNAMLDMEFGKRLGMHTVFITSKFEPVHLPHDLIDEQYPSLFAWAKTLTALEVVG